MRSATLAACAVLGATCALAGPANLTCAAGDVYGITTLQATLPTTFANLQTIIGNFTNSDWQGLTQTSSVGGNTVGSSRDVAFAVFTLNETLIYIEVGPNSSETSWALVNGPVVGASPAFNLTTYQEDLVVNSTCGGAAVSLDWSVEYCYTGLANYSSAVGGLFVQAHTGGVANISSLLHLGNFTTCAALSNTTTSSATTTATGSASAKSSAAATATVSSASAAATTAAKSSAGKMQGSAIVGGLLSLVGFFILA